jgi:hypothetical protein
MNKSATAGLSLVVSCLSLFSACAVPSAQESQKSSQSAAKRYEVVAPGTHPGLLFSAKELSRLRRRAKGEGLAAECYEKVVELARGEAEERGRGRKLNAMALVYQVERDTELGRQAVELFKEIIAEIEPYKHYEEIDSDFFATEHWPKAFAYAWDWLYELMDEKERAEVLAGLEQWCKALYEHTEAWWWQSASINCGAIPVGALGLLCTSIRGETDHAEFEKWYVSAIHRLQRNYFPESWKENGICVEGPCYAQYHKNPTQFGEALRRTGGPDIISGSNITKAGNYQMFQWMPQGECGPIGDNTGYGRRVFAAAYLHCIGESRDGPALWTFNKYTDRRRLNPILAFLWYPDDLEPVSPKTAGRPTSCYFEITPDRAGYLYSRSEWDNERAAYFAFATRYENANHQHYDMNTFLFCAFGEEFGTHRNVFPYGDINHGVDYEHNIVIVDKGGMPAFDPTTTCNAQNSIGGLLTGLGPGHFADYVRGDARDSYQDRSDPESSPAVRADRSCLFVKQGPFPYLVVVDDIRKSEERDHDYYWQWYTTAKEITGEGTLAEPLLIEGEQANCSIGFLEPAGPEVDFRVVKGGSSRYPLELGLIRAHRHGRRVRYASVAAAWEKNGGRPSFSKGPEVSGNPEALSLVVESGTYRDLIIWQPVDNYRTGVEEVSCGEVRTDGLLSVVRTDPAGRVLGYLLADGRNLSFAGRSLARTEETSSVSADSLRVFLTGGRRARRAQPPLAPRGRIWLPYPRAEVFVDATPVIPAMDVGDVAVVGNSVLR